MKKIKYLIGSFIVGFGLLFNQSFGLDVELIDFGQSQYLVEFKNYAGTTYGGSYNYRYLYYNLSYNKSYNKINIQPYYNPSSCSNNSCSIFTFNNSIYLFSGFNSSIYSYTSSSTHPKNTSTYSLGTLSNSPQIVLGTQNSINHGQAFVCVDCFNTVLSQNPKFGLGSDFILTDSYKLVGSDESSYFRLYNEFHTGFDVNSVDFNTMSGGGFPFDSWEYFTNRQTWTSYGRIANQGYAFSYIGSYRGIGYSYIYSRDLNNSGSVSWNNLQFRTVYDQVVAPLKLMAANNQWILIDSDLSGFYYDGVLVFPIYSYNSGLNYGQYLIAKDPIDTTRIVYEMYSCNNNNIESVWSGGGTEFCAKLDAGYLTYNGSTKVLPFVDVSSNFSCSENYPLLCDLTQNFRLSSETVSNGFKIGNNVYGFQSDPSVDIKYLIASFGTESASSQINQKLIERCLNDTEFALSQPVCNWITEDFNNYIALGSGQYMQYSYDSSGNLIIEIIDQAGLFDGYTGSVWIQNENGDWITNCSDGWCSPSSGSGSSYFQSGILTVDYYDFYSNTGLFFKCPYPYESVFSYGNFNLKLGKFDVLLPINCMIAAFEHGRSFMAFEDVGLGNGWGPLIQGDTQLHHILFRFFDFILVLFYLLFFSFIFKRLK